MTLHFTRSCDRVGPRVLGAVALLAACDGCGDAHERGRRGSLAALPAVTDSVGEMAAALTRARPLSPGACTRGAEAPHNFPHPDLTVCWGGEADTEVVVATADTGGVFAVSWHFPVPAARVKPVTDSIRRGIAARFGPSTPCLLWGLAFLDGTTYDGWTTPRARIELRSWPDSSRVLVFGGRMGRVELQVRKGPPVCDAWVGPLRPID